MRGLYLLTALGNLTPGGCIPAVVHEGRSRRARIAEALRVQVPSLLVLDGEEHGQIGAHFLEASNPRLFDEINRHTFMLQLDRRGASDYKTYDIPVTADFLSFIERETGYVRTEGTGKTDIGTLCRDVCGVNLSVGYYNEHHPAETIVVAEWERTLNIVRTMFDKDLARFPVAR